MTDPAKPDDVPSVATLRILQIITGAMIVGATGYLGFVIFQVATANRPAFGEPGTLPLLTTICMVVLVVSVVLSFVLPMVGVRTAMGQIAAEAVDAKGQLESSVDRSDAGRLLAIRQQTTIITYALLEGAGLFASNAYSQERHTAALAAAIVCIALMLIRFPTSGRARAWIKRRLEDVDLLRGQQSGISDR